jgi:exopolyphosphatase/guanosine-5'-triphosphate,3'-diphosphate pyrophosphatase
LRRAAAWRGGDAGGISDCVSVDVGSVRLTERFVRADPPTAAECASMSEEIDRLLAPVVGRWRALAPRLTLVGLAATFTTLVAVEKKLAIYAAAEVHGSRVARDEVRRQIDLYRSLPNAERQRIPGLHPQRADVILAGALLVERIMAGFAAPHVIVSDQGVRYGLLHRIAMAS